VNFSKSDKKKLNELQNNVIDLQRWKSQAQDTLDNLRRDQIKEREVDSKIKTLLAKEIHPKIDQMSQKIGILGERCRGKFRTVLRSRGLEEQE